MLTEFWDKIRSSGAKFSHGHILRDFILLGLWEKNDQKTNFVTGEISVPVKVVIAQSPLTFFGGETVLGELHDKSNNNPCFTVWPI